ncbi:MAG: hypothetical protein K0Q93_577 [Nocardioidaceae bacterium]|nr:hypothetical protein [Nocardioidaceae bacterium]
MAGEDRPGDTRGTHQGTHQGGGRPGETAPTEWIGSSRPPPDEPGASAGDTSGPGGARRRWLIPVAAVAVVALIAGGGFAAYSTLSGGGDQPADAIPSSAIGYARVDLDPAADQKINMVRLLRRVPEFEKETGITSDTDDLRKRVFEEAIEGEGCSELDYDADIAPWIGERAGMAAIPAEKGSEPDALLALQVTDEDAARTGIEELQACTDESDMDEMDTSGLAFVGDYALIAETQELADDFAAAAADEALADSAAFSADMEALGGEGVASFWLDVDAVMDKIGEDDPEATEALQGLGYEDLGTFSAALRAESDAMELVVAGDGDLSNFTGDTAPVTDVALLPDSTLAAVGFTGGGDAITALWGKLEGVPDSQLGDAIGPGGLEGLADQFEAQFGIVLPNDIAVLLGEELTVALDSEGIAVDDSEFMLDTSTLNVGARMRTDPEAVRDLLTRVQQLVAATTGQSIRIADADLEDGIVLASNNAYARALAEDGALGDSATYEAAVADAGSATGVLFVDLDKLAEVVDESVGDAESRWLEVFRGVGVSTVPDGQYTRTTARLVFD